MPKEEPASPTSPDAEERRSPQGRVLAGPHLPRARASPPTAAPGGDSRGGRGREAFFDNAKYLAIVLVALGHAWEPYYFRSRTVAAAYLFVYAFHMPAFVVVSGYFSRTFDASPRRVRRLVTSTAVPYVLFQTAYALFERTAGHDPGFALDLVKPWFLTWFLVALFIWRLTAPLWRIVRWPVPVSLAVAAAACATPGIGGDLDLQRVLQFLPFFVLGTRLRARHFTLLDTRAARGAALAVLAGAAVFAYWAVPRMNDAWLYHTDSAQNLGTPWWTGVLMQLGLFGCSLLLTAAFLAWVPRRRLWCTALGAGTLYGYLLHGFLAKGSRIWHWYDPGWVRTPLGVLAVTLLAALAVTLLCTPPVRRVFRFVVEPRLDWAFKPL